MKYRLIALWILVVGIPANPSFPAQPIAQAVEAALVRVGSPAPGKVPPTFGSGFVIEYLGRVYVVTCRHVLSEAASENLLAIPGLLHPKSPQSTYRVMRLGRVRYHPEDGPAGTYDVAVAEIADSNPGSLLDRGVRPLRLPKDGSANLTDGQVLEAAGYPVDYLRRAETSGKVEALRPQVCTGSLRRLPIEDILHRGFGVRLREASFVQTVEDPLGAGASGGLVYAADTDDAVDVVGLLVGSADAQRTLGGRTSNLRGFVFVAAHRILETVQGAAR